jgi:hypothetical protein
MLVRLLFGARRSSFGIWCLRFSVRIGNLYFYSFGVYGVQGSEFRFQVVRFEFWGSMFRDRKIKSHTIKWNTKYHVT